MFYFFLFLRLLRCFSSPGCHLTPLFFHGADFLPSAGRVPPFGNPRVKGCLPPYRGLSQAAASFIVFLSQGIHHIPLTRFSHIFILKMFNLFFVFLFLFLQSTKLLKSFSYISLEQKIKNQELKIMALLS